MSAYDNPTVFGRARLGFADERDVDLFVDRLEKFETGEISPDGWRAFRLLNGVYSQKQDGEMMIRAKIPQGVVSAAQLSAVADVAERWGNGRAHVTTRQNFQFHFIKLDSVATALRHLADAGITTREACGNSVRTITGCPFAGITPGEPFDTTPYAEALTRHLLRGPWSSKLPRKFKIAVGGCCGTDDVQAAINDLGFLSRLDPDGRPGFRVTIGGGLATLRRSGFVAHEFLPAEQILEVGEAVVRVFDRIGDRGDKHKARLKWAIDKLGVSGFLRAYRAELELIAIEGGRYLDLPAETHAPAAARPGSTPPLPASDVRPQKQAGFHAVVVRLPLGDLATAQLRALARLSTLHGEGEVRTTNEQNVVLRFVATAQVPALLRELERVGLGRGGARTVLDVTSCPGSASCRLAVTASRGVAELVSEHLLARPDLVEKARTLDIKVSGCPNGCGQHYIAGISLQGGVRKVAGRAVPQYHLSIGGGVGPQGAEFARQVGKVPARRVPLAVERLIDLYAAGKQDAEAPDAFFRRVELARVQSLLADLVRLDETTATPDDFVDLGEDRAFEVTQSEGECAA